ncbi:MULTISPECIES: 2-oxoglutarate dehydrogenase complex dihydrolipoyllysine-residue succinyltransferase [Bacillus]|jgi:2-oxoglutarate dehydrogenase E2 component (dihydrolipoamide succinyltransferase)|uniref:Dihydrolipoyllysine-residue succinyltransferase component of 2-oxoglutarate dehydrogenase complex n=2 Tax=Bacillus cereus group TaxID=86661 RepID=Q73BN9_BACC1|nr:MULTISPECIES: 2-oxoglutarate dehydrogenase complex dihydrolipoyllysine-residue succinyltransferase [Bacillus]AAS40308.1 2-oxoglutarate dehydrogenase, E2 component, dihydrolipoamide succinyltransferase [Bacillus cereus ATCC 10987]KMQ32904.1 dihydrolipoamide succinyltransferase [Bacillus cereus]KXY69236.1 dihydrolipoamide succinyltransferase [Bacillus cereus]MCU5159605.1 2-oxoglutarate dehydrogenase complex dihydrolipoyllysine-residue succinyltransferase [Bacillus pacificus]MCU9941405.1 2-oxo
MIEIKVPELAESITEGTISQWLINVGDKVEKGGSVVELETDKVNVEIIAEDSGIVSKLLGEPGDTVEVGATIAILDANGAPVAVSTPAPAAEQPKQETAEAPKAEAPKAAAPSAEQTATLQGLPNTNRPIASPAARKMARELGIDLNDVRSTDPLGRVRPHDVQAHAAAPKEAPAAPKSPAPAPVAKTEFEKPVERVKMSRRRQTIAKRLVEVQQTSAMLTTFNEVDMTAIMELRKERKDAFEKKHDVRLGFMSFFTKAVVAALKQFPLLNAEIQGDELIIKKFYDIGIAVAAPDGLVVPVVRDANQLNFAEIESEIRELGKKARDNKLSLKELQGGTFTITNGGVFGSLMSTPILNSPQVGILGMHKIQVRPVAIDAERMENRPMMYIALSYDHRIVDGKEAVSFLVAVKDMLEDPKSLLLEG